MIIFAPMKRWLSIYIFLFLICTPAFVGCKKSISQELEHAEALVLSNLDSTQIILDQFTVEDFDNEEDKALWAMLSVWRQYRSYEPVIDLEKLDLAYNQFEGCGNPLRRAQVHYLKSAIDEDQKVGNASDWHNEMYKACLDIMQTDNHQLAMLIYQRYEQKLYHANNYGESIRWGEMSRAEAQKCGDIKGEVTAINNLSLSYLGLEDQRVRNEHDIKVKEDYIKYTTFPEAFVQAFKALEMAKEYRLAAMEGKIYGNISLFYSRRFMLDSALYYARKAQDIDEKEYAAGRRHEPVRYLHFADLFRKMGKADSALYYAQKDLNNPSMVTRRNAAFQMYAINVELLEDYKEALEWKKLHDALTDSIKSMPAEVRTGVAETAIEQTIAKEKSDAKRRSALIWLSIIAVVALLFAILLLYSRYFYNKKLTQQEAEINALLESLGKAKEQHEEAVVDTIPAPQEVVLTGNTKETITVKAEQIVYLSSESNYIKVVFVNDELQVKQKMVRQTMANIEEQLAGFPEIVRCHRAFFVGLSHIIQASSASTGGLLLTLDATETKIPVSKTYISKIREALQTRK